MSFSLALGPRSFPLMVFSHLVTRDPCSGNWLCGHRSCWADPVGRVGSLLGDLPSLPGLPQPSVQLRPSLLWAAWPPAHHLRQSPCSLRTAAHRGLPLVHTTIHVSFTLCPLPTLETSSGQGPLLPWPIYQLLERVPTWEGLGGRGDGAHST